MKPVREAGKWHYYPKWLAREADKIAAAFQSGRTASELAVKYDCDRRYIVNLLKAKGLYVYRRTMELHPPQAKGLIKHPSERWAFDNYAPLPQPQPVHRDACLRCRKPFVAEAKTIYICSPCKSLEVFSMSGDYTAVIA